jgi:hydroxysqualene synthase
MGLKLPTLDAICSMYNLPHQLLRDDWSIEDSYAFCRSLTVSHYENFPVGSMLVPKAKRIHVYAIYAFARISDDFSDEDCYEGRRMDYLNSWDELLSQAFEGKADHPVFIALADTAAKCDLPIELFRGLLHAFKQDVNVKRYETLDGVIKNYCRFSADPVGRLILHLFDYHDEELFRMSDCICTALQLTNFWQDVAIDLQKDRVYIPKELMQANGYSIDDLFAHVYDERYTNIMHELVQHTWKLFDEGYPLLESVSWPLSAELRFTWLGGVTILSRTLKNGYNVFDNRPKLNKLDFVSFGGRSLFRISRMRRRFNKLFEMATKVA